MQRFYKATFILTVLVLGYTIYTNILVRTDKTSTFKDYSYLLDQKELNNDNCQGFVYSESMYQCEMPEYSYTKTPDKRIISVFYQYQGNNRLGSLVAAWGNPLKADYYKGTVVMYWNDRQAIVVYEHESGDRFSPNNHIKWIIFKKIYLTNADNWEGFKNN